MTAVDGNPKEISISLFGFEPVTLEYHTRVSDFVT